MCGNNWLVETYTTRGPGGLCKNPEAQLFFGGNDWCKWNIPFQDDLWLNGNGLGSLHLQLLFLGGPLESFEVDELFLCFLCLNGRLFESRISSPWTGCRMMTLASDPWCWWIDIWGAGRDDPWDSEIGDCMLSYQAYRDIHLGHLLLIWPFYRGFDLWMNSKQGTPLRLSNLRLARLPSWPTKAPWIRLGWRSWPATKREHSSRNQKHNLFPQIAIAIGVLTSNRGEGDEPLWRIGRGTRVPLQGAVDVVPLLGAIVVCYGWGVTTNFGGVDVVPLLGAIAIVVRYGGGVTTNFGGVDVVPLLGAIAIVVRYGGGWRPTLGEWTWCHCWVPL